MSFVQQRVFRQRRFAVFEMLADAGLSADADRVVDGVVTRIEDLRRRRFFDV